VFPIAERTNGSVGYALAKDQQAFITRLVKAGKFNNQSEVVREAIRRMQREETDSAAARSRSGARPIRRPGLADLL
jgi:putative addiction module CopG family antidote